MTEEEQSSDETIEAPPSAGAQLEERKENGQWRHYLCGEWVRDGDDLELLISRPQFPRWLLGMYEWNNDPKKIPTFTFFIPTQLELGARPWKVRFELRLPYAYFRWPAPPKKIEET